MKTVTLETAKRLKELGMPQETGFYRMDPPDPVFGEGPYSAADVANYMHPGHVFAAYTAGELTEWFRATKNYVVIGFQTEAIEWEYWVDAPELGDVKQRYLEHPNLAEALGLLAIRVRESQTTEAT